MKIDYCFRELNLLVKDYKKELKNIGMYFVIVVGCMKFFNDDYNGILYFEFCYFV